MRNRMSGRIECLEASQVPCNNVNVTDNAGRFSHTQTNSKKQMLKTETYKRQGLNEDMSLDRYPSFLIVENILSSPTCSQ